MENLQLATVNAVGWLFGGCCLRGGGYFWQNGKIDGRYCYRYRDEMMVHCLQLRHDQIQWEPVTSAYVCYIQLSLEFNVIISLHCLCIKVIRVTLSIQWVQCVLYIRSAVPIFGSLEISAGRSLTPLQSLAHPHLICD